MDEPELVVTLRYNAAEKSNDFDFTGKHADLLGPATQAYIARAILAAIANAYRQQTIAQSNAQSN